ncbi:MAG: hypothetical protein ACE5JB_10940 [bacterium]
MKEDTEFLYEDLTHNIIGCLGMKIGLIANFGKNESELRGIRA